MATTNNAESSHPGQIIRLRDGKANFGHPGPCTKLILACDQTIIANENVRIGSIDSTNAISDTYWPQLKKVFDDDPTAWRRFRPTCALCRNEMRVNAHDAEAERGAGIYGGIDVFACGHLFGRTCLDKWVRDDHTRHEYACCPICKHRPYTNDNRSPLIDLDRWKPCPHRYNKMMGYDVLNYCPQCLLVGSLKAAVNDSRATDEYYTLFRFLEQSGSRLRITAMGKPVDPMYYDFASNAEPTAYVATTQANADDEYEYHLSVCTAIGSFISRTIVGFTQECQAYSHDKQSSFGPIVVEVGVKKTTNPDELNASKLLGGWKTRTVVGSTSSPDVPNSPSAPSPKATQECSTALTIGILAIFITTGVGPLFVLCLSIFCDWDTCLRISYNISLFGTISFMAALILEEVSR